MIHCESGNGIGSKEEETIGREKGGRETGI
jgi:hypothetical protein